MKLPARSRTLVRAIVHGSTLLAVLSPSGLVHAQASAAGASGLEEVLVTARRKEESSQDVPVAITAFSSANLQQMNIVDTQGLQSRVPSLVVGPNGQGQRNVGSPTIRGQGATFQAAPGVALYMAEAPLPHVCGRTAGRILCGMRRCRRGSRQGFRQRGAAASTAGRGRGREIPHRENGFGPAGRIRRRVRSNPQRFSAAGPSPGRRSRGCPHRRAR